jgi:LuxR family transcriptional regulator, maltose regulon positive regulatory protein
MDELSGANEALARAEWDRARDGFERVLTAGETPEALEGLGMAAWWLDDVETVFATRERAFQLYRARGDRRGAARVAIALAQDHAYIRGGPAVAAGWYRRAHRLLESVERSAEHGWLALGEADFALWITHDPCVALERAAEAAAIGHELGVLDLEMVAIAVEGLALVCAGRLGEGMPRLDEATTAATSGEMQDPYAIGFAYCCLVQACERVRDYERAAQWCDRAKAYSEAVRFGLLTAFCRTQHATVLLWRGEWAAAERELDLAIRQLRVIRPPIEDEGTVRLAQLRRLQGRREEAAMLVEQAAAHPLALVERAWIELDRGDANAAARSAERYLRKAHPADVTERAAGLEVLVRARVALRAPGRARAAIDELRGIADSLETNAMRASVLIAEGMLQAASGAHDCARTSIEDAVDLFHRSGAPFETARSRLELARVLVALGQPEAAKTEVLSARTVLAELGAVGEVARADRLIGEIDRTSVAATRVEGNLTARELEVLRLVAQGLNNGRIATRLHLSEFTVKRHIANILAKLALPTRAAAVAYTIRNRLL